MADKKGEQMYTRPPKLSGWDSFKVFLWNSETSQFLGRTGASWGKILLFYLIFYSALIGFFSAMLAVFYQTLDDRKPKWKLDKSLIGSNPGLGFRPMPPDSNVESTLVWYKASDKGNIQFWQHQLDDFLATYQKENNPNYNNVEPCEPHKKPSKGKVCDVQLDSEWQKCVKENGYNYDSPEGGPCIFLKLNKIYGWEPDYYNSSNVPDNMPEYLKQEIKEAENRNDYKYVWVTCQGENPADVENIGMIRYLPKWGFSSEYFPFENVDGYLSPLVAVYFEKPKRGVLINIECKAWAKNIIHDRTDRRGSVHFELMID
ncbi:sodium/potassium-transporting ATPase subunit beta-2 [Coccinella septempunctata]|uniref:sodium/potassium-transporting ATPase subunit beta-2 n=1 Tax=Coccinella septempunctata TaxID=41139 RepID=UPI001D07429F|nr:sodium/potassium-transporting ATPase subunit beta-2 [Coccinella septempunctata]